MDLDFSFLGELQYFTDSPIWNYHVVVPTSIATQLLESKHKRVITFINSNGPTHQALMSDGNGGYFLTINKETRSKLKLKVGSELTVNIKPDLSEYGMTMPEELAELFVLDDKGSEVFHSLTRGKQRSLIHMVAKAKRSETRINRAIVILEYLKEVNGNLDYKELNSAFRNSAR